MAKSHFTTYCIYRIVCFSTFKMYIGLTSNPNEREYEHFRLLNLGTHYNVHLQRAFNHYGRKSFYFEVVERGIPTDEIDARERYWIAHFDSYRNGYNESVGGDLSYRGKSCSWNGIQYDSITAAARANGINSTTMRERLGNGYACDDDLIPAGEQCNKPCVWNGVQYPSQKAAAKALGISKEGMKWRVAHGYTSDEDMPQRRRCTWGGVEYRSIMDCSRATGIPHVTLLRWMNAGYTRLSDVPNRRHPLVKRNGRDREN